MGVTAYGKFVGNILGPYSQSNAVGRGGGGGCILSPDSQSDAWTESM